MEIGSISICLRKRHGISAVEQSVLMKTKPPELLDTHQNPAQLRHCVQQPVDNTKTRPSATHITILCVISLSISPSPAQC